MTRKARSVRMKLVETRRGPREARDMATMARSKSDQPSVAKRRSQLQPRLTASSAVKAHVKRLFTTCGERGRGREIDR